MIGLAARAAQNREGMHSPTSPNSPARRKSNTGHQGSNLDAALHKAVAKEQARIPKHRDEAERLVLEENILNDVFEDLGDCVSPALASSTSPLAANLGSVHLHLIASMQKQLELQAAQSKKQAESQQELLRLQRRQLRVLEKHSLYVDKERLEEAPLRAHRQPLAGEEKAEPHKWLAVAVPGGVESASNCLQRHDAIGEADELVEGDATGKHTGSDSDVETDEESSQEEVASAEDEEQDSRDALAVWRACSGLHTVDKWVLNYRKHPAGWAALLMIHGIPEVTGRLRSKVENYAIYSALFLSVTIPAAFSLPTGFCGASDDDWDCIIRTRLYGYSLIVSILSHMFAILLGMSFVNALNEAARDSDVYRMFARGKGFKATVKCEMAFFSGVAASVFCFMVAMQNWLGWDALVIVVAVGFVLLRIHKKTAHLLFSNASLVLYWRTELGGKPDADDPYDLVVPAHAFQERAKLAHLR